MPIQIASPQGSGTSYGNGYLAVGGTHVYLSYGGTPAGGVVRVAKDGSEVLCIACDEGQPRGVAVDDANVYWVDTGLGELRAAPLDGRVVATLWSGDIGPQVAVDADGVYWVDQNSEQIMRSDLDGGNPVRASDLGNGVTSFAIKQGEPWVCWTTASEVICQWSDVLLYEATERNRPRSLTADGYDLYWSEGEWGQPDNMIARNGASIAEGGEAGVYDITVDGVSVYVADNYGGNIWKVAKDGGPIEVLATDQEYPFDIGVDDTAVYWTSETTGELFKVGK